MKYMYISSGRVAVILGLVILLLAGGIFLRGRFVLDQNDILEQDDAKEVSDLIRLTQPRPNNEIMSPLTIEGEARGTWYFEATFPVVLVDWDGLIIAEGYAEAQDEWMTEQFVPFRAVLTFKTPSYGERGALILRKSNPSGLPEHDNALEVPILFKKVEEPAKEPVVEETGRERGGCIISGCSGQVCGEHDLATTCEYRDEYACYEHAVCERQTNGQCGWTLTAAVGRCLMEMKSTL